MPPALSFEEAARRVREARSDCELIQYIGIKDAKGSIFRDFEYGKFEGRLCDVIKGQKNHPEKSKKIRSDNLRNPETRRKIKKTNKKRYGGDTPFHNKNIQRKAKQAQKEIHGVDNISQSLTIKRKKEETCFKNYGVKNPSQSSEICDKKVETLVKNGHATLNYDLEDLNRLRTTAPAMRWKKTIINRDKKCIRCDSTVKLVAHHILNFAQHKELRYDPNNGVTLCTKCHKLFHNINGNLDNNKNQLKKFLKNRDL